MKFFSCEIFFIAFSFAEMKFRSSFVKMSAKKWNIKRDPVVISRLERIGNDGQA